MGYILGAWCLLGGKGLLLNPVQGKGLSGKLDIILDVGSLPGLLVRQYLKALYHSGEDSPDDDGNHYPPSNTIERPTKFTSQYGNQQEPRADDHYCQKNPL
ncbi:unnamed protein product, partial [marine sediment metagenome]